MKYQRAALYLALAAVVLAQTPQAPVIIVTTRLVEVNVIVRDHKGPVEGLTKADFTILDKGRPQKIAVFSMSSTHAPHKPPAPLPPNVFTNIASARQETPTTATVVLLDTLHTPMIDQPYARQQVIKFLKEIRPEDRVAVYVLGRKIIILNDFTNDSKRLMDALTNYQASNLGVAEAGDSTSTDYPDVNPTTSGGLVDGGEAGFQAMLADARQNMQDFANLTAGEITAAALEAIANHLGRLEGRKNLVWVTSGIPLRIDQGLHLGRAQAADRNLLGEETFRAVKALNDADIAVYPVDARGLMLAPGQATSASRGPLTPAQVRTAGSNTSAMAVTVNHDAMIGLAQNTGGVPFYNTNDIKGAVRRAVDDSEVTYTLGFYPDSSELDSTFHELKVQVNRKGVDIRHRAGYRAAPDAPKTDAQRNEELRDAMWSPLEAASLGLAARVEPVDEPVKGSLRITLSITPSDLGLQMKDGKYSDALDYMIAQRSADGRFLSKSPQGLALNLDPDKYRAMMAEGLHITKTVEPLRGAVELRILLLDRNSGKLGTVIVPLKSVVR